MQDSEIKPQGNNQQLFFTKLLTNINKKEASSINSGDIDKTR